MQQRKRHRQLRTLIKKWLSSIHLEDFGRRVFQILKRTRRDLLGVDRRIIRYYLKDRNVKKLHLGCGNNILRGWLNTDYVPRSSEGVRLDVTKPLYLPSEEFHYIFSEHMIEHITFSQGLHMLAECHRVLRKNGKIRIATPDLLFLVDLYSCDKSDMQKEYIKFYIDNFIKDASCYEDTFVINDFMRSWGHKFIYDEKILGHLLESVGFTEIVKCSIMESEDEELKNLENEGRMPEGFLKLESIILEGTKL